MFVDANNGWLVDARGEVHGTHDGGATWTPLAVRDGRGPLWHARAEWTGGRFLLQRARRLRGRVAGRRHHRGGAERGTHRDPGHLRRRRHLAGALHERGARPTRLEDPVRERPDRVRDDRRAPRRGSRARDYRRRSDLAPPGRQHRAWSTRAATGCTGGGRSLGRSPVAQLVAPPRITAPRRARAARPAVASRSR